MGGEDVTFARLDGTTFPIENRESLGQAGTLRDIARRVDAAGASFLAAMADFHLQRFMATDTVLAMLRVSFFLSLVLSLFSSSSRSRFPFLFLPLSLCVCDGRHWHVFFQTCLQVLYASSWTSAASIGRGWWLRGWTAKTPLFLFTRHEEEPETE